ncbi:MAG: SDR family oxidoreductase [Enhydrobacter sp.]|nr:SDR family oxidoreductase [Enhydrobacter sp.]
MHPGFRFVPMVPTESEFQAGDLAGRSILVVGVTGFLGAAVARRLGAAGAAVVGVSRSTPAAAAYLRHIRLDIAAALEPAAWRPHLAGIDGVVYCAGALQDGPGDSLDAVHASGPAALFAACSEAGVRRVVHLSALGADRAASGFSATKRSGDEALQASDLQWAILRPAIVIGPNAFGGAALLRALAALPLLPVPRTAALLRPVHIDDVVNTVLFFLRPGAPAGVMLDLVGPRAFRFEELVAVFRGWLGRQPATVVPLPEWLAALSFGFGDAMAWFGWRSAVRSNAGRELAQATPGDATAWTEVTGIVPRDIEDALRAEPASVQDRWFAGLYLLRPALFAICGVFWIVTGLVSLGPGWRLGIGLMNDGGVVGGAAAATVVAGALCDIAVGAAILWRRTARVGVIAGIVVTVLYAVAGTALVPRLWIDPLGAMLKVFPIIALHLAALAIVDDR